MFRMLIVAMLSLSVFLNIGCSAFKSKMQPVVIQPTDPTAEVYVDGELKGTGTITTSMARNRNHIITAKVGQRTGVAHVDKSIAVTGVLDIIGTFIFIVPLIGVFTPGFYDLDPDSAVVVVPAQ